MFLLLLACFLFYTARESICVFLHTGSCLKIKTGFSNLGYKRLTDTARTVYVGGKNTVMIRLIAFARKYYLKRIIYYILF